MPSIIVLAMRIPWHPIAVSRPSALHQQQWFVLPRQSALWIQLRDGSTQSSMSRSSDSVQVAAMLPIGVSASCLIGIQPFQAIGIRAPTSCQTIEGGVNQRCGHFSPNRFPFLPDGVLRQGIPTTWPKMSGRDIHLQTEFCRSSRQRLAQHLPYTNAPAAQLPTNRGQVADYAEPRRHPACPRPTSTRNRR